jgi:hypothetical protein
MPSRHIWGVEVQLHSFLTSAPDSGEWSASRHCRFVPSPITGPLSFPLMIYERIWCIGGMLLTRETEVLGASNYLSTLGQNRDIRGEKPATNSAWHMAHRTVGLPNKDKDTCRFFLLLSSYYYYYYHHHHHRCRH